MAWIPLTSNDIENSLMGAEQVGLNTPDAQADLAVIVTSVIGLVRGKVNSNKRNQGHLGPPGTIPEELYAAAISIGRFKFLTHLPSSQLITEDRRADRTEALQMLSDAADGTLVVIRGDDTAEQSPILGSQFGSSGSNLQGPNEMLIIGSNEEIFQ